MSKTIANLFTGFGGGAITILLVSFVIFLSRHWILGLISKSMTKNIEKYKHELDSHKEAIKHDLQKEMLKAQIQTNKIHEIYPKLFEEIKIADGAISNLTGFTLSADLNRMARKDLEYHLRSHDVPDHKISELLPEGDIFFTHIDKIKKYMDSLEESKARQQYNNANNYYVINQLYVSDEVAKLVDEVMKPLWNACSRLTLDPGNRDHSGASQPLKDVKNKMEELKLVMRAELQPKVKIP